MQGAGDTVVSCDAEVSLANCVNGKCEIDISSCVTTLQARGYEVEVHAVDSNGNKVGTSHYAKADHLEIDATRTGICYKGQPCRNQIVVKRKNVAHEALYNWFGYLQSTSSADLQQSMEFANNRIIFKVSGTCENSDAVSTSKATIHSQRNTGEADHLLTVFETKQHA